MKKAGILLIAMWYALAFFADKPFLPYPHAVAFHTALALFQGSLVKHLTISAYRIFVALIPATVLATWLGLAAGRNRKTDKMLTPFAYIVITASFGIRYQASFTTGVSGESRTPTLWFTASRAVTATPRTPSTFLQHPDQELNLDLLVRSEA